MIHHHHCTTDTLRFPLLLHRWQGGLATRQKRPYALVFVCLKSSLMMCTPASNTSRVVKKHFPIHFLFVNNSPTRASCAENATYSASPCLRQQIPPSNSSTACNASDLAKQLPKHASHVRFSAVRQVVPKERKAHHYAQHNSSYYCRPKLALTNQLSPNTSGANFPHLAHVTHW
jgi:hypothetical protein